MALTEEHELYIFKCLDVILGILQSPHIDSSFQVREIAKEMQQGLYKKFKKEFMQVKKNGYE